MLWRACSTLALRPFEPFVPLEPLEPLSQWPWLVCHDRCCFHRLKLREVICQFTILVHEPRLEVLSSCWAISCTQCPAWLYVVALAKTSFTSSTKSLTDL